MSPPASPPKGNPPAETTTPQPKPQPMAWSHEETLNLIQAYQEKWYFLKRGQLKASQWEEVAATVAARCGFGGPTKSGTQCRHKIEKLRKRYRAEKQKPTNSHSAAYHGWIYYPLMDQLEHGPLSPKPEHQDCGVDTDDEEEDGEDEVVGLGLTRLRSVSDYHQKVALRAKDEVGNGFPRSCRKKRKTYWGGPAADECAGTGGCREEEGYGGNVIEELAGQMRGFAERFIKMERKKMEVMRENERYKMEMENKRLEMILVSQQKTAHMISKAFDSCQNQHQHDC